MKGLITKLIVQGFLPFTIIKQAKTTFDDVITLMDQLKKTGVNLPKVGELKEFIKLYNEGLQLKYIAEQMGFENNHRLMMKFTKYLIEIGYVCKKERDDAVKAVRLKALAKKYIEQGIRGQRAGQRQKEREEKLNPPKPKPIEANKVSFILSKQQVQPAAFKENTKQPKFFMKPEVPRSHQLIKAYYRLFSIESVLQVLCSEQIFLSEDEVHSIAKELSINKN